MSDGATGMPPMAAPWANAASSSSQEDQQRLLQEKLARAKLMKPGAVQPPIATHNAQRSPPMSPVKSPPPSPGLVRAPWAVEPPLMSEEAESGGGESPLVCIEVGGVKKEFRFRSPTKVIKSPQDLLAFKQSETYAALRDFVLALNNSCKGKPLDSAVTVSPACQSIISMLQEASRFVDEIPPTEQPMRYGNKAFRNWMDRWSAEAPKLVESILPQPLKPSSIELAPYLVHSFGNKERIDYGTGHEQTFVTFIAALAHVGFLVEGDLEAIALRVFWEYLKVARKLQLTYRLEPAGSHGCWSLDDYQFIPFMWGSAQLIDHPAILPSHIHDLGVVRQGSDQWYYLHCVKFIHEVKSGQLAENSPMLNDISGCCSWQRVNSGMLKMYFAEVMDKLPVIQHMMFGSIFKAV